MHHVLKLWPRHFEALASGERRAEIRRNDRDFNPGDTITFREYDHQRDEFTGRAVNRNVTYVMQGPFHDDTGWQVLPGNFCILSLARPSEPLRTGDDDVFTWGAKDPAQVGRGG